MHVRTTHYLHLADEGHVFKRMMLAGADFEPRDDMQLNVYTAVQTEQLKADYEQAHFFKQPIQ